MSDEQEQERDAAVIAEMRNLLTAATPGNWRFKTFSTAMDGDEEIGELTTDGPVVCDVMWATGDWKGKSDWLEFRSEADKVLIERAKEDPDRLLRERDRPTAERYHELAERGRLPPVTMEPKLEQMISDGLRTAAKEGSDFALPTAVTHKLLGTLKQMGQGMLNRGFQPIVVTAPGTRTFLKKLLEVDQPNLIVLSTAELPPSTRIQPMGIVKIEG